MRPRIYIDTSVIGGCFDDEFKEHSNQLFGEFASGKKKMVVSDLVLFELEEAPENVRGLLSRISEDNIELLTKRDYSMVSMFFLMKNLLNSHALIYARELLLKRVFPMPVI